MGAWFRGRWWIVAASFTGMIFGPGPISVFAFAVLLRPITTDLGIGRGMLASGGLLANAISTFTTTAVGFLIDRYGARRIMVPGTAIFALGVAAHGLLTASPSVIYLIYGGVALFGGPASPVSFAIVVSKWFDRRRGLALGLAMAGVGVGAALVPLAVASMVGNLGWRYAYAGLGVCVLLTMWIPVTLFIREPGEAERAERPDVAASLLAGVGIKEAVSGWRFWAMTIGFFLAVAAMNGTLTQIPAMLMDRGLPLQRATGVLAFAGVAIVGGRILSGWCVDRFFAPYVAVGFFIAPMAGILLLGSGAGLPVMIAGSLLCGLAVGAEVDLMAFLTSRYFGLKSYGRIFGTMFGFFAVANGVGPFLAGMSHDLYHTYAPAFALFEGALVVCCVLLLPLGPYRFAVRGRAGGD